MGEVHLLAKGAHRLPNRQDLRQLMRCGGGDTGPVKPNFMDSTFVDDPKVYRATLDSIKFYENLDDRSLRKLRSYIGKNRKAFASGWTYQEILESAENNSLTF